MDEAVQTRESEASEGDAGSQQQSGAATPVTEEEAGEGATQGGPPAGQIMEKNYTDTIENLLSELWKERLV